MCFLCPYICWPLRCCPCLNKDNIKRTHRKKAKPKDTFKKLEITSKDWESNEEISVPEQIKDKNLSKEYKVPGDYPSVEDCLRAQDLKQEELIGEGTFAQVYKMIDTKGTIYAAKRLQTGEFFRSPRHFDNLKSELFVMIRAKEHENIVRVEKHFIITHIKLQKEFCYIVMEFANGGTVLTKMTVTDPKTKIKKAKRLPEGTVRDYCRQIAKGLAFLHSHKIAHKDLTLNNLLVFIKSDEKEIIKITDFGLSRISFNSKEKIVIKEKVGVGTVQFMSPQILRLHIYDQFDIKLDRLHTYDPFRADCWALGICLYVMITAEYPFSFGKQTEEDLLNCYKQMNKRKYVFSSDTRSNYSKSCLSLISELLDPNPNTRLTAKLTLLHKWIKTN